MNKAELFIDCKNKLGEGITWDNDDQTLYWLDIPMPSKLYKHNLETNNTLQFDMPEMITAMAIRQNNDVLIASLSCMCHSPPKVNAAITLVIKTL